MTPPAPTVMEPEPIAGGAMMPPAPAIPPGSVFAFVIDPVLGGVPPVLVIVRVLVPPPSILVWLLLLEELPMFGLVT